MPHPFFLKDCSLAVISTGESAASLIELRDVLQRVPISSIYYHFWGERLRTTIVQPEFQNGFAKWAHMTLRDRILAEKLGILDPTAFGSLEDLRYAVLEVIEERLDEIDFFTWSKKESKFFFLRSVIIIFDAQKTVKHPSELKSVMPLLPLSAIFYHFIDARKRTPEGSDDFTLWLKDFGKEFESLIAKMKAVDPYFYSLSDLRKKITAILAEHFP
jgi:hypothetical protein